jgi:hypothetical protein
MTILETRAACPSPGERARVSLVESPTIGRWVLATLTDRISRSYELTFSPDISEGEWDDITDLLPEGFRLLSMLGVGGQVLGIPRAVLATFA